MHEFGIAEAVLDAVERRANGRPVRRARLRAGALLRIAEPAMGRAFALVTEGTVAEGATLELVIEPVRLNCRTCGESTESADPLAFCPSCGGADLDSEGGDGLVLESIQIGEVSHVPGDSRRDRGDRAGSE
ncbi:hydrogenase maturation nickel metallochaperone HypA [Microbispora sp. RL4-1S]|uniref:Hydrogenase maturation factor HypA n=1 Tax=Microbispora oryzae TaxID=2806554 RepID=A0A940WT29_9ACTN|nr:hydrogenase maturation nickel metallochaperone HypA [Microbispora oryzae]MBP2706524.1 hydrogenase maturation nickel metallochaperone HypA [Microbispora oryzae]